MKSIHIVICADRGITGQDDLLEKEGVDVLLVWPIWALTVSGRLKALAKVYAELVKRLNGKRQVRARATTTLTYSLLGLYTCRGYKYRMWDEVHATVQAGQFS